MNKTLKSILILLIPGILYLIITLPFRELLSVFTITDVRLSIPIVPLSSIWFGPLASLSCAIGNLIGDYVCGYPTNVLVQGLPFQFVYGFVCWLLWKKLTKGDEHSYRFNSISKVLKFALVSLVFGLISATGVSYLVYSNYAVPFFTTFPFIFMNNFDMTMLFGCPLMIVANLIISKKKNEPIRKLLANEITILFSILLCFVGAVIIGFVVYGIGSAKQTIDIWNTIYIYSAIFINIVFVLMFVFIAMIEKKTGNK